MKEAIEALHQRIKDLAANSTPDQLAYLAKSLELIADKKAIADIVQMTEVKEIIDVLQKRLKDLAENSTPDQLAYLAKALESIVDKSAVSEIVQMTDGKLKELLDSAKKHLNDINSNKTNSISAITAVKTESVNEINKLRDNSLNTLKASSDSHISLLDTRKNANIAAINSVGNDHKDGLKGLVNNFRTVNDVPSGSSIMKEVRNRHMIEPGALPFLFGVLSRKNNYFGHGTFTTELGQWSSDVTKTDYMLQLLAGTHTYDTSYVSFYRPRQLSFLEGSKGTFIYGESYPRFMYDGFSEQFNMLKYPYAALGVIFVKNTSNVDISKTLNFVGSAMWYKDEVNYGGAGLFIGTPDKTNTRKSEISRITWTRIYQHEINSPEFIASGNIIIPAGKTVTVLLYTSSNLHSEGERVGETPEFFASEHTYSTIYGQFIQWGIYNFRSNFLTTGLEIDVERTLRAWQCPGLSNTHEIWR
ncbi:hypothetical protein [Wolbachia endosymbiont (group A) of Coremacera marginata]|uniref:hypothetical protein n=1 Tax=Wolbachia endosymbiont (group A) of Coremacera marginata TaxID=2953999 RepID=UPI00222FB6A5|nr:hypothetical protein [Wolbachia endosymbiont (group A) of Coremacera marginata]